ncbi:MAG: response regulator transcription factor [Gallionella sp.]
MENQSCGIAGTEIQNESVGLSAEERAIFFEAIEPGLFLRTEEEFVQWTQTGLQKIFPHGMLACGIGVLAGQDMDIKHVVFANFPQEYVDSLQQANGLTNSPIMARWMRDLQPILFEPDTQIGNDFGDRAWLEKFHQFGLINVAAHGQCDLDNESGSYFSFSRIPGSLSKRHALLLQLLVPHLHSALVRITPNLFTTERTLARMQVPLTQRESEILKWLSKGKTNAEIAQLMYTSESTVKKHVQRVLLSMGVSTRTEAVAKAIKLKLISSND